MKDLTKNRWKFVLIPALIVLAGIVLYIVHGGFNFDVEFMGGTECKLICTLISTIKKSLT